MRARLFSLAVLFALLPAGALAASIVGAWYDPAHDEIVADIAYRGTAADHQFSLLWGPCHNDAGGANTAVARLVDAQGDDFARKNFRVRARFSLGKLKCRPAQITLRLGRVSNVTVDVPALKDEGRS